MTCSLHRWGVEFAGTVGPHTVNLRFKKDTFFTRVFDLACHNSHDNCQFFIYLFIFTSKIPSLVQPVLVWWTMSFFEPPHPVATHPKLSCAQHTPHPNVLSSPRPWSQLQQSSVFNPWGSLTTRARQLQSHNNGRSLIRREQTLPTAIYWLAGMVSNGGSDHRITCHRSAHTHTHTWVCMCVFMNITQWLSSQGSTFWAKTLANTETAAETAFSFT